MPEFTLEAMAEVRARYNDECHERKKHRADTLKHLADQEARAIEALKQRKSGVVGVGKELWTELNNYEKDSPSGVTGPLIRKALRAFLEKEQNGACCYCQRPLVNIAYAKPIEHILPRVDFVQYTFCFWNLAVACFDCNQIKLDDVWVGADQRDLEHYPAPADFTRMYHPRFHRFAEHVRFIRVQTNELMVSIYVGLTEQGRHLCLNLLKELSAREILLNSNRELRSALEVIHADAAEYEGTLPPALEAFHQALAMSMAQLTKPPERRNA